MREVMSVVYSRLAVPALSFSVHRHPFHRRLCFRHPLTPLLRINHFTAVANQRAEATALSPEHSAQTATPVSDDSSFPILQPLSSQQKEQISLYIRTLLEWNQRMNLTAVMEENEVMTRHVEDSLAILPPLRRSYMSHCQSSTFDVLNVVDVGSGAGLPGLILAIAYPIVGLVAIVEALVHLLKWSGSEVKASSIYVLISWISQLFKGQS